MWPSQGAEARAFVHDTKALFVIASFSGRQFVHVFRIGEAAGSWKRAMTNLAAYHPDFRYGKVVCLLHRVHLYNTLDQKLTAYILTTRRPYSVV